MATINFFIQGNRNPVKIWVRVRDGIFIDSKAHTGFIINKEDWDTRRKRPKHLRNETFRKLNYDLENIRNKILEQYNHSSDKTINSEWLRNILHPETDDISIPDKLIDYIDYYIDSKRTEIKSSTITKFNVIKNKLIRFESEKGVPLSISDVNPNFKNEFEQYSLRHNYSKNTIARDIRFIKTFCRHARNSGIRTDNQLDLIQTNTEKVEKIYLTLEELERIKNVDFDLDSYLDNARDWLIILCFTAQRVSDALKFSHRNIRVEQGYKLIEFTQVKTNKIMTIPVLPEVQEVLEKRNGQFPRRISDVKLNKYIKEVCERVGINEMTQGSIINKETKRKETGEFEKWKLVTTHIGRRSFATNFYGNKPTALLISMTGHSTETQFLEYIGKSRSDSAIELAKLFN